VDENSNWYWQTLNETMCVPFPVDDKYETKKYILKWMDGAENMVSLGNCSNSSASCKPVTGCAGTCCSGKCWMHDDPELRPTGGTPIGKTLFYIGEYLKNRVVVDGKTCSTTNDCGNVNYVCKAGKCVDPARSCRDTVVVLFTDGGEAHNVSNFFSPWNQAKRLAMGLGCQSNADCVGGGVCKAGHCLPESTVTGYFCSKNMQPCLPSGQKGDPTYCDGGQCIQDPRPKLTKKAKQAKDNVLRSPDGNPFGVRLHVVDISEQKDLSKSMNIAIAGGGNLLGAAASDPNAFLATLNSVFDIKNKKVCGEEL
jgi:hypothetical protein